MLTEIKNTLNVPRTRRLEAWREGVEALTPRREQAVTRILDGIRDLDAAYTAHRTLEEEHAGALEALEAMRNAERLTEEEHHSLQAVGELRGCRGLTVPTLSGVPTRILGAVAELVHVRNQVATLRGHMDRIRQADREQPAQQTSTRLPSGDEEVTIDLDTTPHVIRPAGHSERVVAAGFYGPEPLGAA
jgi:hypothetical protein